MANGKLLSAETVRERIRAWNRLLMEDFDAATKTDIETFVLDALPDETPQPPDVAVKELREVLTDLVPVFMDALLPLLRPAPDVAALTQERNALRAAALAVSLDADRKGAEQWCAMCSAYGGKHQSYCTIPRLRAALAPSKGA